MKIKIIDILIVLLVICIIVLLAAAGIIKQTKTNFNNKSQQFISGIYFYQIDYLWAQGIYTDSNTGLIEVNINELNALTGLNAGYVNVYTNKGWVIHNLAIVEDLAYPTVGIYFDLGQTGDVKSIDAYVEYTVNPLTTFEYSGALPPYPVGNRTLNAEDGEDVIIAVRPQPPDPDFLPGNTGDYNPVGLNTHWTQKEHPNFQAAN